MFSEHIEELWKEWYEKEKPKKIPTVLLFVPAICIALLVCSIVIMAKYSETIGVVVFISSLVLWIVVAWISSGNDSKISKSSVQFCWDKGIYTVGKDVEFEFLPVDAQFVLGGRSFTYRNEKVTLYDTCYMNKDNSPGIVIEIEPLYPVGDGVPKFKKGILSVPEGLGLSIQCVNCMQKIMDFMRCVGGYKMYRNDNKFYIYIEHTSMGLILDTDGMLYQGGFAHKQLKIWKNADEVYRIINTCLGDGSDL